MGIHTMLVAPLAAGGQLLGVLAAGSYGRRPALTARHLDLAQEVAQHAAVAIVNARALQEAKQSRAFLRAMMEQTGEAIMVLDAAADRILDANAAAERLTGRTRAELLRCGMRDLVGVRGLQPWRRAVANLGDAETGTERAVLRLRAADLTVTVEAVASRVATPTGTVVMAVLRHSAP
jgi:PAS domain S-box-containing protein